MRIKELIKEKGFTQAEFAEKLGISRVGLNQIINGKPSYSTLEKIAIALDVEISDLFAPSAPVLRCPHCGKPINVELTTGDD